MAVRKNPHLHSNVLIVLLALSCSEGRYIKSFAGPYIVAINKIHNCELPKEAAEKLPWTVYARVSHYKPTQPLDPQRITGNVTGTSLINDTCLSGVTLARRSNNQWKENALVISFPQGTGCSSIFTNAPYISTFMGDLYTPHPCTVKPGHSAYKDANLLIQHPNVPIFPYGEYRLHFTMKNIGDTHPLLCYTGEVSVIPKP